MAADLILKTEDRRLKTEDRSFVAAVPRNQHMRAAQRRTTLRPLSSALRPLSSVFCHLSSVICLLSSALCHAEELRDPTRPPAEIAAQAPTAAPRETGLQTIIISPARRAAIINGQTVELGGNVGNAKLVGVSESGVVLQEPQGRRALALFPDVQLKNRPAAPPEQTNKKARGAAKPAPAAHGGDGPAAPKEKR